MDGLPHLIHGTISIGGLDDSCGWVGNGFRPLGRVVHCCAVQSRVLKSVLKVRVVVLVWNVLESFLSHHLKSSVLIATIKTPSKHVALGVNHQTGFPVCHSG